MKRLKKAFPRLPICLSVDSLFACGPVMSICEDNGWKYIIVHKQKSIPYIQEEFEALLPLAPENHRRTGVGPQREIKRDYRWINDISYVDTDDNEHSVGVLECLEDKPDLCCGSLLSGLDQLLTQTAQASAARYRRPKETTIDIRIKL